MKKSYYPLCLLAIVVSLVLGSCQAPADHTAKIATLDSLSTSVNEAELRFNTINYFNTDQFFKGIQADLSVVQDNYEGAMDREMAELLAQYRSITKVVKNFSSRHKRVKGEIIRTKSQLLDLKQALQSKATQDSQGNQFTAEYVEKVFNQEQKVAESLIEEIDDMIERLKMAEERYEDLYPRVSLIVDSIKQETEG